MALRGHASIAVVPHATTSLRHAAGSSRVPIVHVGYRPPLDLAVRGCLEDGGYCPTSMAAIGQPCALASGLLIFWGWGATRGRRQRARAAWRWMRRRHRRGARLGRSLRAQGAEGSDSFTGRDLPSTHDGAVPEAAAQLTQDFAQGAMEHLSRVDPSLWPLLMSAAEAEASNLSKAEDIDVAGVDATLSRAAHGLAEWREHLEAGRIWEDADGANWPVNRTVRDQWTDLLRDLDMPRFTRRHPQLLNPLLANLLEIVEGFEGAEGEAEPEQGSSEASQEESGGESIDAASGGSPDSGDQGDDAQSLDEDGDAEEQQAVSEEPDGDAESQEEASRVADLFDGIRQQWQDATDTLQEADATFGTSGGSTVADGLGQDPDTLWRETFAWKEVTALRNVLSRNPDIRELIRNLGRRSALKGPLRRLPQELAKERSALGVVKSVIAPAEANGVCLSGEWDSMLPSEAQLLASSRPMLRSLHHARRIERSLLSYDRSAWVEEQARRTKRSEPRPLGKSGPLIVCLDTSGSMQGAREMLGKALVLESLRQAHRQQRPCYLYAFSGQDQVQELELELTAGGLQGLLDFLKFSFSGATSLDAPLEASVERLNRDEDWRNADVLIVTDGEVPMPREKVVQDLERAQETEGTRIVGIVLGSDTGDVMEQICTELYTTGDPGRTPWGPVSGDAAAWGRVRSKGSTGASAKSWPKLRAVPLKRTTAVPARAEGRRRPVVFQMASAVPSQQRPPCDRPLAWPRPGAFCGTSGDAKARRVRASSLALAAVAGPGQRAAPDFNTYGDGLLLILQDADRQARRLRQKMLGTEALLLALLTAPAAEDLRAAVFPTAAEWVPGAMQEVEAQLLGDQAPLQRRRPPAAPLKFTPMSERALLDAEAERQRLRHDKVEPSHLLLALLQDPRGAACGLLAAADIKKADVRRLALEFLPGSVAAVQSSVARHIDQLHRQAATEADDSAGSPAKPVASLGERLAQSYAALTQDLVERSVEAKLLLLAALGGEHVFFLGPPGTAKSLLARRLALVCRGRFFERLLTRFSVPEEVFGPLSLRALEEDELRRKTEGFLPEADVAFLDEVFKANSSILNALLTILNERMFDNGGARSSVPLWCAVAASNELPESEDLNALFDRFLLRRMVPRLTDESVPQFLRTALATGGEEPDAMGERSGAPEPGSLSVDAPLTAKDSEEVRARAQETVDFPDRLLRLIARLRIYLRDEAEPPVLVSDRRLAKSVRLLRIAAFSVGADSVSEMDLLLLQHMLWDQELSQVAAVREWLLEHMADFGYDGVAGEKQRGINDALQQARFVFEGVCGRLRKRSQVSVSVASRDLGNLQRVLEDQLQLRLATLSNLRAQVIDGQSLRAFWLEDEDREEIMNRVLPRLQSAVKEAEGQLREVAELAAALQIPDDEERTACVEALVGKGGGGDADIDVSFAESKAWAAKVRALRPPDLRGF